MFRSSTPRVISGGKLAVVYTNKISFFEIDLNWNVTREKPITNCKKINKFTEKRFWQNRFGFYVLTQRGKTT